MADKVWDDIFYIRCYQFAQAGLPDMRIAKQIGVTYKTFKRWLKKRPALRDTIREARKAVKQEGSFRDYVYKKLDYGLRQLWNMLEAIPDNSTEEIESILADRGDKVRQRLFIHALVNCAFNPSEAMAKVNVTRKQLNKWNATDAEFADLVDEIQYHKKNFVDGAMFKLVEQGHPGAILFAQERLNDDRGYGKKMKVKHEGGVDSKVTHIHSVEDLDLPMETLLSLRYAMNARQKAAIGFNEDDVVDGEFEEVE